MCIEGQNILILIVNRRRHENFIWLVLIIHVLQRLLICVKQNVSKSLNPYYKIYIAT